MFHRAMMFLGEKRGCAADMAFAVGVLKFTLTVLVMAFFLMLVGQVEGVLWPVIKPESTHITSIQETESGFVVIGGQSNKQRPECRFDHIEWYLGLPGQDVRVDVNIQEASKNRGEGEFTFGPWEVQLTPDQLLTKSHAVVFSSCHNIIIGGKLLLRLWLTESTFWASSDVFGE